MTADLINRGIAACQAKDYEKGVQLFGEAIAQGGHIKEALYNRARALAQLDKQAESLADFARLKELHPTDASIVGDYAVSLHLNDKNAEAEVAFDLALSLEPNNPYRHSSMAFFKDRIGQHEAAIAAYERAIALDPEDAIALNNKGLIEEKLGRKQAAIDSFNQSNKQIGYAPEKKDMQQFDSQAAEHNSQEPAAPSTRMEVVKSLFTRAGFKEFIDFAAITLRLKSK
jgi:tetratricopeptide (TPR) repeat protein